MKKLPPDALVPLKEHSAKGGSKHAPEAKALREDRCDQNWSIVDILFGRHHHEPVMKITVEHRVYHNYRFDEPSRRLEMANGGRQRNRAFFDDPSNDIAQAVKTRRY